MSPRTDVSTWRAWLVAGSLAAACASAGAAKQKQEDSVCPVRPGAAVSQIEIFDGDPSELASLAPEDDASGANTYKVADVYDQGRYLTIRCHYGNASLDVRLATRVAQCKFSGGDAHPKLACK